MPGSPAPPAPPWIEALDEALVTRLRRPLDGAGIIPLSLANRILAWVGYFSGRIPLVDDVARRHGRKGGLRAGDVPIVHARSAPSPSPEVSMSRAAPTLVERVVVRALPPREGAVTVQPSVPVVERSPRVAQVPDEPAPAPRRTENVHRGSD